jgi:hypothetical protein
MPRVRLTCRLGTLGKTLTTGHERVFSDRHPVKFSLTGHIGGRFLGRSGGKRQIVAYEQSIWDQILHAVDGKPTSDWGRRRVQVGILVELALSDMSIDHFPNDGKQSIGHTRKGAFGEPQFPVFDGTERDAVRILPIHQRLALWNPMILER